MTTPDTPTISDQMRLAREAASHPPLILPARCRRRGACSVNRATCPERRPHPPHNYVAWHVGQFGASEVIACAGIPGRRATYV